MPARPNSIGGYCRIPPNGSSLVTPFDTVPKSSELGETLICGCGTAPLPLSGTVCGLAGSLVSMVRTPMLVRRAQAGPAEPSPAERAGARAAAALARAVARRAARVLAG